MSKAKQKGTQGENEILEMLIAHGNLDAKLTGPALTLNLTISGWGT